MSVCDLSISIASFNTLDLTRQCLRSIYDNSSGTNLEVFLVDNNSSDGSADAIEAEFPQAHVIHNDSNLGVAAATNQAISASRGRYFLTMNSDTVVKPGSLEKLVQFMDGHPDAGAATARLVLPDGSEHIPICGEVPTPGSEIMDALSPLSGYIATKCRAASSGNVQYCRETREVPGVLWGTAFIVRREVIDQIGGQDPRFFVYSEDTDWSMRITKAGWKLFYVAEAEIIHYGGQSTKQVSVKALTQLLKNKCRLIQKHYGLLQGWALRLAIAGVCVIRLAKWLVLYPLKGSARKQGSERIEQMWRIIRAVLTY